MTKKNDDKLSYLQMPLPRGTKRFKSDIVNWSGLNKTQTFDTGVLSAESNISTDEAPYLTPSPKRRIFKSGYENPISLFGFDGFMIVVYRDGETIKIDYIKPDGTTHTGVLKADGASAEDEYQRSIVKFNVYDTPTDPIGGSYVQKLLIFPDKKSIDFTVNNDFLPADLSYGLNQIPDITYAAVHLSRLFGVDSDRIYVSGFNDYSNWNLDTIDEYNPSNAWASPAQSNVKANGRFTGITLYRNGIICFKRDFMHEVYNNKNPFRIGDIFAEGTVDNRSIQEIDGTLFFAGADGIKAYGGGNPRDVGGVLNERGFYKAVAGAYNNKYYLYCSTEKNAHSLYVYNMRTGCWTEESVESEAVGFANITSGMYMLCKDGNLYRLDTDEYSHSWYIETDFVTGRTIDIKHIAKIQLLAELAVSSSLDIYLMYDGESFNPSASHKIYSHTNLTANTVKIPIRVIPRQTANYGYKMRIRGFGYVKLYQLEIFMRQGGELYV